MSRNEICIRKIKIYGAITVFFMVFASIYELFSHQVYSAYMIGAFLFPLIGGVLPYVIFHIYANVPLPGDWTRNLYGSGVMTLTLGSVMTGIIEIYGTTNRLLSVYWIVGMILVLAGCGIYMMKNVTGNQYR